MNVVSPAHFKETTTLPAFTPHQQQCFCQDVFFPKAGFILLSTKKGDYSPGMVPRVVHTATCSFSLPVMGALVAAGGLLSAPLGLCAKHSCLHLGRQWYIHNVCSQLPGFGVACEHWGLCVHPPIAQKDLGGWKPPTTSILIASGCLCAQDEQRGCKSER